MTQENQEDMRSRRDTEFSMELMYDSDSFDKYQVYMPKSVMKQEYDMLFKHQSFLMQELLKRPDCET